MNPYQYRSGPMVHEMVYEMTGSMVFAMTEGSPSPPAEGFPEGNRTALWLARNTDADVSDTVQNEWATFTCASILKNAADIAGSTTSVAQNWFPNNVTLTAGRTGPDALPTAIRIVSDVAGGELVSSGQSIPAGTYTLVLDLKSNTGAQTVKIGQSSTITSVSVTTTWTQFVAVFTLGGVAGGLLIAKDNGGNNLDIDADNIRLYSGDVSADVPVTTPMEGCLKAGLNDPPSRTGNVYSFSGSQHMMAQWDEPFDISTGAITHFHIVRRAADAGTIAGIIGVRNNGVSAHMFGFRGLGRLCYGDGFNQTEHQQGIRIDGKGWQVLIVVADPVLNEYRFYVGRQLVQILSGVTVDVSTTYKNWLIGYLAGTASCDWLGGGMYLRVIEADEIDALVTACEAEIIASGEAVGNVMDFETLDADSITSDASGNVDYYGSKMVSSSTPSITDRRLIVNLAVPGAGYTEINGRRSTRARYLTDTANRNYGLLVWWTNAPMDDIDGGDTYLTNLTSVIADARTDGFDTVITATQTPKSPTVSPLYNTNRAVVTAGINGVGADAVVDHAADARYGDDADAENATLYPDKTHPSDTVQGYMAENTAAVYNAL